MILELGFFISVAVAGWLCLAATLGRSDSRSATSMAAFGLAFGFWSVGELLRLNADSPEELVLASRVFYMGTSTLPAIWLWVALRAAEPSWFRRQPAWAAVAFVIPVMFYSTLYSDGGTRFVHGAAEASLSGGWYGTYLIAQVLVASLGTFYFARAASRLGHSSRAMRSALSLGVALPMFASAAFALGFSEADWTAAVLGPAGILIWIAVVDSGLSSRFPVNRDDVIDQLDVGVVVADLEGRILQANAAAKRLAELDALPDRNLTDAVAAAEQRPDAMIETRAIDLRGRLGVVGHALILTDRTDAEVSRRRLELAGRLEALGSLTAGIAHEVNNPLSYVQSNLSALGSISKDIMNSEIRASLPAELDESVAEMGSLVEETQEGVERIRLLVQRLKHFARTPDRSTSLLEIDLSETIRQAAAVASVGLRGDPIRIEADPEARVPTVETAVFQILVNLLLNAVQASQGEARIQVTLERRGEGVGIDIADDGPGIPESLLPRIFDPFFTTKPTGTGLGLSLSYDLAQQVGGRLDVANRDGGGAIFSLWLPAVPPEEAPSEESPVVA